MRFFVRKTRRQRYENALSEKEIGSEKCESGEKMLTKQKTVAAGVEVEGTPLFITDAGARINGLQTIGVRKLFEKLGRALFTAEAQRAQSPLTLTKQ